MQALGTLLFLAVIASPLEGQKGKGKCSEMPADSTIDSTGGAVYRHCDVDHPAKLRGSEPRIDFRPSTFGVPRSRCYAAEFQFIVDTLGAVDMQTVRAGAANDRDLQEAVMPILANLKYDPARLTDRPVRQIVTYRRTISVVVSVVRTSSATGGAPPSGRPPMSRPPRC